MEYISVLWGWVKSILMGVVTFLFKNFIKKKFPLIVDDIPKVDISFNLCNYIEFHKLNIFEIQCGVSYFSKDIFTISPGRKIYSIQPRGKQKIELSYALNENEIKVIEKMFQEAKFYFSKIKITLHLKHLEEELELYFKPVESNPYFHKRNKD